MPCCTPFYFSCSHNLLVCLSSIFFPTCWIKSARNVLFFSICSLLGIFCDEVFTRFLERWGDFRSITSNRLSIFPGRKMVISCLPLGSLGAKVSIHPAALSILMHLHTHSLDFRSTLAARAS